MTFSLIYYIVIEYLLAIHPLTQMKVSGGHGFSYFSHFLVPLPGIMSFHNGYIISIYWINEWMNEWNSIYSFLQSLLLSSCHSIPILFGNHCFFVLNSCLTLSRNLTALAMSSYSDQCWDTMSQDSQVKANDESGVSVGKKPYLLCFNQPTFGQI